MAKPKPVGFPPEGEELPSPVADNHTHFTTAASAPIVKWVWLSATGLGSSSPSGGNPTGLGLAIATHARDLLVHNRLVELGEDGGRLPDRRPDDDRPRPPRRSRRVVAGDDGVLVAALG